MLKSRLITLSGRDAGLKVRLTELPAMLADRHARGILRRLDVEIDGGVSALAFKYSRDALKLGAETLLPLLQGTVEGANHSLDVRRDIKDWRNVERLQHSALLLHVDFLIDRVPLEIPVTFQAQHILSGGGSIGATFCSPQIAAVLDSGKASYRELETVLSTEDAYNICEIINVSAIRDWHAQQANQ